MSAAVQERGSASNQYELLARLAEGGMAEIFLARVASLAGFERHVVLKRIHQEHNDDPRWVNMFLDEARLAAQLHHPNIAQVFDLGRLGDAYFYTMEYVHGEDVRNILARTSALNSRVPIDVVLSVVVSALAGLSHAHDRCSSDGKPLGVVHRDVSPSNIMVSYEGVVKVVDFGVAKATSKSTETQAGTIMGKVAYLSPEQCRSWEIDHRSDLFSLGIVMYELLTHERPFRRVNDYETLQAVVRYEPPPPSTLVPAIPPELDAIVMRALAKDPADRFATATEMLEAIEEVADTCKLTLAPRSVKRFMRDLFGNRPEPWRELEALQERGAQPRTYSGEVIGPFTESIIGGFPANTVADLVPLLNAGRLQPAAPLALSQVVASLEESDVIELDPAVEDLGPTPMFTQNMAVRPQPVLWELTATVSALPVAPVVRQSASPPLPRRMLIIAGTVVVVVASALGIYALLDRSSAPATTTVSAPRSVPAVSPANPTVTPIEEPKPVVAQPPPAPVVVEKKPVVVPIVVVVEKKPVVVAPPVKPPVKPAAKPKCNDPLDCQF
ncbi:MAG: serine/threonine-protein kinase [Kofleriaceae bacterium]